MRCVRIESLGTLDMGLVGKGSGREFCGMILCCAVSLSLSLGAEELDAGAKRRGLCVL